MSEMKNKATTLDWLLDQKVRLHQFAKGYRAGMDAVVLAAALRAKPGERLLEAGCGAGAALLCAASRLTDVEFAGVERDQAAIELVQRNIDENRFGERVKVLKGDVGERPGALLNAYDHVFSNPPFFEPGAIQALGEGKDNAYLAHTSLEDWLKFMLHAVRPKGRITLIHRAAALADILAFMNPRFGEIEVLPVKPYIDAPAKRVLVTGRKGLRKGDVALHAGLTLYEGEDRKLTERAAAIMSGGALDWR